jgi:hypothetical protein
LALSKEALKKKSTFNPAQIRFILAAIRTAWSSDSMTQGPRMKNI